MIQKNGARVNEEVIAWANNYFCENKEVLQVLGIDSVGQLINRILKIQTSKIEQIVEL
jgi:hypothetical protein